MQLTRNLRLAVAGLIALHLASAFAAIALLGRMRPAIEKIIDQNVYSLSAVEEMLSVLAEGEGVETTSPHARFRAAYDRAAANITDERERPILMTIDRLSDASLPIESAPRHALVAELVRLGEVNRDNIVAADHDARRLGTAGAWSLVFLATLTLGSALAALRRMDRRVLQPVEELHDVLLGLRRGEHRRRCRPGLGAADELAQAMAALNRILDDRQSALVTATAAEHAFLTGGDEADRATLLHLLDESEDPVVVVEGTGEVVACNHRGLDRLSDQGDLKATLARIARGEPAPRGIEASPVKGADRYVCVLDAE
ncbi:MAG TPA: hypothetical protein ENK57_00880 [Polyangiaceae bacterium]|nr:hypothetical protein [Polyangiaceae bacterium]